MAERTRVLRPEQVVAVKAAAELLRAVQRFGLKSCSDSQTWENADQHDAVCLVRKAEQGLRALLREHDEIPVTDLDGDRS